MFIARKSENIQEDIKRNWSSWNFGQLGFDGTIQELKAEMEKSLENETSFDISGFELWGDDIIKADIRELYQGYWVLVDNVNSPDGLSCIDLDATTLEDAIIESKKCQFNGSGETFDASDANLVYSENDIHIFEIDE